MIRGKGKATACRWRGRSFASCSDCLGSVHDVVVAPCRMLVFGIFKLGSQKKFEGGAGPQWPLCFAAVAGGNFGSLCRFVKNFPVWCGGAVRRIGIQCFNFSVVKSVSFNSVSFIKFRLPVVAGNWVDRLQPPLR